MHSSHDEDPTTESTPKPNLHQTFQWKSKNYEVLSQLLNTLALSESQAELVLLGVRNKFRNLIFIPIRRLLNWTKLSLCRQQFLK